MRTAQLHFKGLRWLAFLFISTVLHSTATAQQQDFIPIDHKGEQPSSHVAYLKNAGQLTNMQGGLATDVLYYSIQNMLQMFFTSKNEIFFQIGQRDTSATTADAIYKLGLKFVGETINMNCQPNVYEEQPDHYNFILGHCPNGIFGVHAYRRIVYPDLYPGIDLHIYSNPFGPKFYLVMHPGSDPNEINMEFQGQDSLLLDGIGHLKAYIQGNAIILPKGLCYQQIGQTTELVELALPFELDQGNGTVKFQIGQYNPDHPLIIDISASFGIQGGGTYAEPEWCTFYGNTESDYPMDAILTNDGSLIVTGETYSPAFPLYFAQFGVYDASGDVYYSEFNADYSRIYTTFFGGNMVDHVSSVALSPDNSSIYLYGRSASTNLPLLQATTGFYDGSTETNGEDCYIAQFSRTSNPPGVPQWVTKYGAGLWQCNCMAVDGYGNVHIIGNAESNATPSEATCNGTTGTFPVCDPGGDAIYRTIKQDQEMFYARFNSANELVHSTYFGGSAGDQGISLVVDKDQDRLFFLGNTNSLRVGSPNCNQFNSGGFPLCNYPGSYFQQNINATNTFTGSDAFVGGMTLGGVLFWSTFFGSTGNDNGLRIGLGHNGDVYINGQTSAMTYSPVSCAPPTSVGLPHCASGTQAQFPRGPGPMEMYVARFNGADLSLAWSSFLTGNLIRMMPDPLGNVAMGMSTTAGSNGTAPLQVVPYPNMYFQPEHADAFTTSNDGFVRRMNVNDEVIYASYLGGRGLDGASIVLPFQNSRFYVVSSSQSTSNFPFHCPPTDDPYCYLSYATQVGTGGEAYYAQLQYDITIGMERSEGSSTGDRFLVYPNPTNGSITVELPATWTGTGPPLLDVYDATGKLVLKDQIPASLGPSKYRCELSTGKGLYLLHLHDRSGSYSATRSILAQ